MLDRYRKKFSSADNVEGWASTGSGEENVADSTKPNSLEALSQNLDLNSAVEVIKAAMRAVETNFGQKYPGLQFELNFMPSALSPKKASNVSYTYQPVMITCRNIQPVSLKSSDEGKELNRAIISLSKVKLQLNVVTHIDSFGKNEGSLQLPTGYIASPIVGDIYNLILNKFEIK